MTFRETIEAKLSSISRLRSIVGSRIYPGVVPQTHDFGRLGPALAFFIHGYPRGHTLSGSDRSATATVEFLALGYSRGDVDAMTLAIWDALDGVPTNPWGDGTITILACVQQDESDHAYPPRDGSDQWVFSIMSEYKIMHRVSSPTLG